MGLVLLVHVPAYSPDNVPLEGRAPTTFIVEWHRVTQDRFRIYE